MANRNRDNFPPRAKLQIAKRAGWLCSHPACRNPTVGGEINIGTAAHICAAAPDGPRYDPNQTPEQRSAPENGIWMCRDHGTAIDSKDPEFTVERLREWKARAESEARAHVLREKPPSGPAAAPTEGELVDSLRAATRADLDVFRRSGRWPSTDIALTFEVEGFSDPVSPQVLATMLATLDDLILVAPPGMGKTTTVFQIAEALSATGRSPIVVPLADWSTEGASLLESLLRRPAFREISEERFRSAATKPGVMLLLDGWNELDAAARKRLTAQVRQLQAELPEVTLLISTRRQALDVPVDGARVNLLPLSETQQLDIAKALRGDAGLRIVDEAWRTAGIRELVSIPLYLRALITLPEGAPFPTTKEEVLRRFVAVHEEDVQHAEALVDVMHGSHGRFLEDLAVAATHALTTTFAVDLARSSVAKTVDLLVEQGQLTEKPQPNTVLEALVAHHVLTRSGDPAGYSFQHQQFQEWYASGFVERLMMASIGDAGARKRLKADVLNLPAWEESILFACERLARAGPKGQEACADAVLAAFEVDPMLAAEMIFRGNDPVWARVTAAIQERIRQWHTPGKVDRALRFMISSGRSEFLDLVWPLITHENDQIHLAALRAGRRFRPSILGSEAVKRIGALPPKIRGHVLQEIASNSGMDGLDLATAVVKNDSDPEIKAAVVEELAFRGADRHVIEVLRSADGKTFDRVVRTELIDDVADKGVKKEIEAARARQRSEGVSAASRLRQIVYAQGNEDLGGALSAIVAEMDIRKDSSGEVHLIYEARKRYARAIADGLLQRVRAGRTLFHGADDLLASAGMTLEDDQLLELALVDNRRDQRADAAASVLGPVRVSRMIEALLEAKRHARDAEGKHNQAMADRYHDLRARIHRTPGASLIAAVQARSARAGNVELAELSDLVAHHADTDGEQDRPFDAKGRAAICDLAEEWGTRMLASVDATRHQLASVAALASRGRSVRMLPLLKRLLDEELRRYREFRKQAEEAGWHSGAAAVDEARTPYATAYQRAFQVIEEPETAALIREYLKDEYFGQEAALVVAAQWTAANEPSEGSRFRGGIDFSRVEQKRLARTGDPSASSAEADAILSAIEQLTADGTSEAQKKHAVALGIVAARLPHGQWDVTIQKLISLAPRQSRAALLLSLLLSGETIDVELVKAGIEEVYKAAETQPWILHEGWQLKEWLSLLPFSTHPAQALAAVRGLPADHHRNDYLETLTTGFAKAPGDDAEDVLFQLAEAEPSLYASHEWREAALGKGTVSAARRFIDLASREAFKSAGVDGLQLPREIAGLMGRFPELRALVYEFLEDGGNKPGQVLLAHAVAEHPDVQGFLLLVAMENKHKRSFMSWRTIESLVTENVPSEEMRGAYNVVPVPAVELRQELLAKVTDGGPADTAARHLNEIDGVRDEYGTPDSEPRHPDLESGKPWPIMRPADG